MRWVALVAAAGLLVAPAATAAGYSAELSVSPKHPNSKEDVRLTLRVAAPADRLPAGSSLRVTAIGPGGVLPLQARPSGGPAPGSIRGRQLAELSLAPGKERGTWATVVRFPHAGTWRLAVARVVSGSPTSLGRLELDVSAAKSGFGSARLLGLLLILGLAVLVGPMVRRRRKPDRPNG